jgi:phosphohistidine phosphatase
MNAPASCILVRHAHAEWPAYTGRDFDRPLTGRGLQEARTCAQAIAAAGLRPAQILSSPARRTQQTAEILASELQLPGSGLVFVDALYNAAAEVLQQELRRAAQQHGLVMLVAHNPGISELGRRLGGNPAARAFAPAEWRRLPLD